MISVIVERSPGDRQGPDITDELITTEAAAVARGTYEIDKACSDRMMNSAQGRHNGFVAPGSIAAVVDAEIGNVRAMVNQIAIVVTRQGKQFTADSHMELEREDV